MKKIFDNLTVIKEEIKTAPKETKEAFNKLVDYLKTKENKPATEEKPKVEDPKPENKPTDKPEVK